MKTKLLLSGAILSLIFASNLPSFAQEKPWIIEATTLHWNMEKEDYSFKEWKELETEYHQKVTMKNEYIKGAEVLIHTYSPDNSELLVVRAYESIEDLEKSADRDWELILEAWPDSTERRAKGDKVSSYYSNFHSDEIYSMLNYPKLYDKWNDSTAMVFYMKKTHSVPMAKVKDGSASERSAVFKEFIENIIHKNDDILAYYPMRHLYGSDSRDQVEFFVYESLEKMVADDGSKGMELAKAHWPDEKKREAFVEKLNKYTSPWHGDWIYTNVPELHK